MPTIELNVSKQSSAEVLQSLVEELEAEGNTLIPYHRGIRDIANSHQSVVWVEYTEPRENQDATTE